MDMCDPSSECPEIDLLNQNVDLLREKLLEFRTILGSKKIDHPKERQCQSAVLRQLDRYEKSRLIAERAASYKYDRNIGSKIAEALDDARETTAEDVLDYHRAMLTFDRRTNEYKQSNILARQFLSPRTRFNEAWEKEARVGPSAFPEFNMLFIAVGVFAVLLICSMFSSAAVEARCNRHPTIFQKQVFEDIKSFTFSDIACTLRQSLLSLIRTADDISQSAFCTVGSTSNVSRAADLITGDFCSAGNLSERVRTADEVIAVGVSAELDTPNLTQSEL